MSLKGWSLTRSLYNTTQYHNTQHNTLPIRQGFLVPSPVSHVNSQQAAEQDENSRTENIIHSITIRFDLTLKLLVKLLVIVKWLYSLYIVPK